MTAGQARLWLGTVAFGSWGNADHDDCVAIIRRALDHGINALDCAATYADGEAEEIVGRAIKGRRDETFITTKYGYDNTTSGSATLTLSAIVRSLDASLQRLGTDHVDLFFLHRVPATADRVELAHHLDVLVRSGRTLAVGTSMAKDGDLRAMHVAAAGAGLTPVSWEQPPHSLFVRLIERSILPTCAELGVQVSTFAPFNGGWLTGKYRRDQSPPASSRAATWPIRRDRFDFARPAVARKLELAEQLAVIAGTTGRSLPHLALDFSLSRPDISSVIVGARSAQQLDDLLAYEHRPIEPEVAAAVDAVVPPQTTVDDEDVAGYRT